MLKTWQNYNICQTQLLKKINDRTYTEHTNPTLEHR